MFMSDCLSLCCRHSVHQPSDITEGKKNMAGIHYQQSVLVLLSLVLFAPLHPSFYFRTFLFQSSTSFCPSLFLFSILSFTHSNFTLTVFPFSTSLFHLISSLVVCWHTALSRTLSLLCIMWLQAAVAMVTILISQECKLVSDSLSCPSLPFGRTLLFLFYHHHLSLSLIFPSIPLPPFLFLSSTSLDCPLLFPFSILFSLQK